MNRKLSANEIKNLVSNTVKQVQSVRDKELVSKIEEIENDPNLNYNTKIFTLLDYISNSTYLTVEDVLTKVLIEYNKD